MISIYAFNLHFDIFQFINFLIYILDFRSQRTFCITLVMSNSIFLLKILHFIFGPWSILSVFLYKMWNLHWGLFGFAYKNSNYSIYWDTVYWKNYLFSIELSLQFCLKLVGYTCVNRSWLFCSISLLFFFMPKTFCIGA